MVVISLTFLGSVTAQDPPPIWSVTSILYLVLGLRPEIVTVVSITVVLGGAETEVWVVDPGFYKKTTKSTKPTLILRATFPSVAHSPVPAT